MTVLSSASHVGAKLLPVCVRESDPSGVPRLRGPKSALECHVPESNRGTVARTHAFGDPCSAHRAQTLNEPARGNPARAARLALEHSFASGMPAGRTEVRSSFLTGTVALGHAEAAPSDVIVTGRHDHASRQHVGLSRADVDLCREHDGLCPEHDHLSWGHDHLSWGHDHVCCEHDHVRWEHDHVCWEHDGLCPEHDHLSWET